MALVIRGLRMCQQDAAGRVTEVFQWDKTWSLCSQAAKPSILLSSIFML